MRLKTVSPLHLFCSVLHLIQYQLETINGSVHAQRLSLLVVNIYQISFFDCSLFTQQILITVKRQVKNSECNVSTYYVQ
jgi:hypothetical protein